jgi:hypothetical protein
MTNETFVEVGGVRALGWLAMIVLLALGTWAFQQRAYGPAIFFVAFSFVGAYMVYGSHAKFSVNDQFLEAVSPLGAFYQLRWSDVAWVEVGTGGTLVFHAAAAHFVLPPPAFWSGPNKPTVYSALVAGLESRKLIPVPSNTADYKFNRNVRVKNTGRDAT